MKLRTLAIAVAMASVPFAAQAEFKVGGDVGVGYFKHGDGETFFGGHGSEVTFDASEKVGGLTYFGHFEVNVAGATVSSRADVEDGGTDGGAITLAGQLRSDDMYVGVKGAFGSIKIGDTDNGCDAVDTGWVASDQYISHSSGGCKASDQNNITYAGARGPVSYAVSYSPDVDNGAAAGAGEDSFAVGVKGTVGPAAVSLGYESETSRGNNVVLGVSGSIGPVSVGVRANKYEDDMADGSNDALVGFTANYSAGNNTFYLGLGDVDNNDTAFVGYTRKVGSNTSLIAEFVDDDSQENTQVAIGMKHNF
jgi:hypothetical protein